MQGELAEHPQQLPAPSGDIPAEGLDHRPLLDARSDLPLPGGLAKLMNIHGVLKP